MRGCPDCAEYKLNVEEMSYRIKRLSDALSVLGVPKETIREVANGDTTLKPLYMKTSGMGRSIPPRGVP